MKFTEQQRQAIWEDGGNLLVAAAAGSGKTAVLVERIVRLISQGASIDAMLIVTFTNAAAAEMRQRIAARLEELAQDDAALRDQIDLVAGADISTLHSFCARILRQYFQQAGIDPRFRVLSQWEADALLERALDEALDAALAKEEEYAVLRPLGDADQLVERIMELYKFLCAQSDPELWWENALNTYAAGAMHPEDSAWGEELHLHNRMLLENAENLIEQARAVIAQDALLAPYEKTLDSDWQLVQQLKRDMGLPREFARLASVRGVKDNPLAARVKTLRDLYKEAITERFHPPCTGRQAEEMRQMHSALSALGAVVLDMKERYGKAKASRDVVDYNDLEHMALSTLRQDMVQQSVRAHFTHVFVDEYQDINPLQEALIQCVSRGDNAFFVGDVKQSIYRFRMADPTLFIDKYAAYRENNGGKKIDLNQNFRSREGVLHFVNRIFRAVMSREAAELDYDDEAALVPAKEDILSDPVQVLLIDKAKEEEMESEADDFQDAELEARCIAGEIRQMLGKPLAEGQDPVRPGDIAILMRSVRSSASIYLRALQQAGIPAYSDVAEGAQHTLEGLTLLDLAACVDNRLRDLPLMGALRQFAPLSVEELAQVRLMGGDSFYAAVCRYCEEKQDALALRLRAFMDKLDAWREVLLTQPLDVFLWQLLDDTGYYDFCGAMPDGAARQANLRALIAQATLFTEQKRAFGSFLQWAAQDQSLSQDAEGGMPRLAESGDDAVHLISVHKSKGLQFPIVFGARLGGRFQLRDTSAGMLLHRHMGVAARFADTELNVTSDTPAREGFALRLLREQLAEEMRVLYVMLTRAQEKLILVGTANLASKLEGWALPQDANSVLRAKCFLDWIVPCLLSHEDGKTLWQMCGVPPEKVADESHFALRCLSRYDFAQAEEPAAEEDLLPEEEEAEWEPFIAESEEKGESIAQKISVTTLLRGEQPAVMPAALPAFLQEEAARDPLALGTAMHTVMQLLDLKRLAALTEEERGADIVLQVEHMVAQAVLSSEMAQALSMRDVQRFFSTSVGGEVLQSPRVYREMPFTWRVQQKPLQLLQGAIDLCYEKEEGWVLIDYKTDHFDLDSASVRQRHGRQLQLYARALQAATDMPVKKAMVYLAALGSFVEIPLE